MGENTQTFILVKRIYRSSCCGTTGLAASLEHWDAGLIPGLAQQVKDPALLQPWHKQQLWLRSEPWPRNSIYVTGQPKKEKKKDVVYMHKGILFSHSKEGNAPFVTTWMNLQDIIPSEISLTEKGKHHMVSLICRI